MCSIPKMPAMPASPAMAKNPDTATPETSANIDRKKALSSMGIESTKLTGTKGLTTPAPISGKKLLGE